MDANTSEYDPVEEIIADVSVIALVSTELCRHTAAGEPACDKLVCSRTSPPMCYSVTCWGSTVKVNAIIEK